MKKLKLRPFFNEDITLFSKWLYRHHIAKWYHDPLNWMDEVNKRNDEFSFLHHFIVELELKPIGFCQYYEYCRSGEDWHGNTDLDGTYSIDYLIGEAEYLGKGYGKGIIQLLIEKIKLHDNAKRIIVQPEPANKPSCNTLLACGFRYEKSNKFFILDF